MKKIYSLILLCSLILISCGGDTKTKAPAPAAAANKVDNAGPANRTKSLPKNSVELTSIPKERILDLWNNCTYIDYIFHTLPFSMSQDEETSIRANLAYIAGEPQPFIPGDCKSIARQMFHVDGEIVLEADVYLSESCQFYVFVENEKPIYANKMTPEALEFFSSMFNQANKKQPRQ